MDRKIEHIGDGGHANIEGVDMRAVSKQITKVMREKILAGIWPPETRAEIEMLREHRKKLSSLKKC